MLTHLLLLHAHKLTALAAKGVLLIIMRGSTHKDC